MTLIDTYNKISAYEVLDCRLKSIQELVRHYGLHLSTYQIMALCESISFKYGTLDLKNVAVKNIPYAVASEHALEETFFEKLNIEYVSEIIPNTDGGWASMRQLICADTPIMFWIDGRIIHHSDNTAPKELKLNIHYLSTFLLVGYTEEDNRAQVIMTDLKKKGVPESISLEQIQYYRNTKCLPFSPECRCFYIANKNGFPTVCNDTIKIHLISSLKNITQKMLQVTEPHILQIDDIENATINTGLYAMNMLKDDLINLRHRCEVSSYDRQFAVLTLMFLRNNLIFGSFSAFREEFAHCLFNCAEFCGIEELAAVGKGFIAVSRKWNKLFMAMSKALHLKDDMAKGLKAVISIWQDIIEAETKLFAQLNHIIG